MKTKLQTPEHPGPDELAERLRIATDVLETLAADMSLLDAVPKADRHRLQQAVAGVYHPDPVARRQRLKAAERARSATSPLETRRRAWPGK